MSYLYNDNKDFDSEPEKRQFVGGTQMNYSDCGG